MRNPRFTAKLSAQFVHVVYTSRRNNTGIMALDYYVKSIVPRRLLDKMKSSQHFFQLEHIFKTLKSARAFIPLSYVTFSPTLSIHIRHTSTRGTTKRATAGK